MDRKTISEKLSVSGQISPADVAALGEAGVKTIICNRPDGESPDQPCADDIRAEAEKHGIAFHHNPVTPDNVSPEAVAEQGKILRDCGGEAFAYCGSGKRATVLWALSNPEGKSEDERLKCAAAAGYDLEPLRHRL